MDTGFISTGLGMLSQEDYEALAATGSAERNLATGQLFDPDAYAFAQTWNEWTSGEFIRATPFPYLLEQQYLDECSRHAIDAFLGWPFFGVHDSTRARHLLLNIVRDTRDMERPSRNVYENMPLEIVRAFIRAVHARTNPLVVNSELRHFRTENSMLRESYLFVRNHTLSASMAIGDGKTPRQQLESIFRSRRTIIWSRQHYVAVRRVEEFPASSPPCYAWLDSLERGIILLSALGLARRLCERLLSSYGIYALCLIDTATPASATTVDATATAIEEVVRRCSATSYGVVFTFGVFLVATLGTGFTP